MGRGARGECRMPLARPARPLKRLKTAVGSYWKKGWHGFGRHEGLGLAPCRLGIDATSAWDRRDHANSQRDKSQSYDPLEGKLDRRSSSASVGDSEDCLDCRGERVGYRLSKISGDV
jgi:hypothetical protein